MYGTLAGWQSYVLARGITGQLIDDDSLPALVRASDYIKYHYVVNFIVGYDDTLPEVEMATYEAACIENLEPNFFSRKFTPSDAKVLMQVDSLRWEKVTRSRMDDLDNSPMVPVSTKVEMYLRRFMRTKSNVGLLSVGSSC